MIEVEKKFLLNDKQDLTFLQNAKFLEEKKIIDIYYDNASFSLTSKNIWLRSRNGDFELKSSVRADNKILDTYNEITIEKDILKFLSWGKYKDLKTALSENKYQPFCICKTIRKKYKFDDFIIDIDLVDFEDFVFNSLEIELLVENDKDIEMATEKIINFAS